LLASHCNKQALGFRLERVVAGPIRLLLVTAAIVPLACAQSAAVPADVVKPMITVNALDGVPIDRHLYGANDYWYNVPDARFDAFAKSLTENCGITLLRFPGGFESEHYEWSNNTLDPTYRNYTVTPGVTPEHVLKAMGDGNVTFVVRTQDALEANTKESYELWASKAADLVTQYGSRVQDWQIGNEWYNVGGAHKHYNEFVGRYATLLSYFAPAMKQAAERKGYHIRLVITANWGSAGDIAMMRSQVPAKAWSDVDGLDIHVYTGRDPWKDSPLLRLPISSIQPAIAAMKKDSGKNLVYVSEWMATLQDDDRSGGLENANTMMTILGEMARAGVTEAAYWPPVWPAKDNGKQAPQADTVTLVHDDASYSVDADGQAMKWLSLGYRGAALSTAVANSTVKSLAAKDGDQVTVFVIGGTVSNETERVRVNGFRWSQIVSAQVMYASPANVHLGPAVQADISAKKVMVDGSPAAEFVINPGGSQRGAGWEIVKLVLR
jgi:alpha-L-arabinofuranosidase